MTMNKTFLTSILGALVGVISLSATGTNFIPRSAVARAHFGNDAGWYQENIPFFACSDRQIEDTYYYRWQLYKAHIRNIGKKGFVITEFLDNVGWDREPYCSLNDATGFHIYEGRWLADKRYIRGYIDFLYRGGGNDRHFSESIADAAWANHLVDPNPGFLRAQLPVMKHIFNLWDDHYDFAKGLYFIEPLLDATEYTISSIDASGAKDGFTGGHAFRPSINSYMYANAIAISRIAALDGDAATAAEFAATAERIKANVQRSLWNESFTHFTDRFQVNNAYVKYWDFIRGRELVGYVPWTFNLPDDDRKYAAAWLRLLDRAGFRGAFGLRTTEPSFEYYMRQYRYDKPTGKPECQWNGPSWPFQTTQVLLAMANLLNNYSQEVVGAGDYLDLLRLYSRQHMQDGRFDLEEDFNPDTGAVIVGLDRSHHYNHSGYADLVITGLCGLRPRADDVLEINPLFPASGEGRIDHLCLENVLYHGHRITVLYDRDGKKFGQGAGLSVFVDGRRVVEPGPLQKTTVPLPPAVTTEVDSRPNLAVNLTERGFPEVTASYTHGNDLPGKAVDGRTWYFPEMANCWSCVESTQPTDWLQIDFGRPQEIGEVRLSFLGDGAGVGAPRSYEIQRWDGRDWVAISGQVRTPANPTGNCTNIVRFTQVTTRMVRIVVTHKEPGSATAVTEVEVY